jgi:SPP1 gp7 family putative phage head morphogenesis protein
MSLKNVLNEYYFRMDSSGTQSSSGAAYKRQAIVYREKTIDDWIMAVTSATDPDDPRRGLLYRFYQSLYNDEHLQTTIDNRVLPVQQAEFNLVDDNDNEDEEAKKLLDRPWYHQLIRICFLHQMQGVSLADISHLDENLEISHVEEVPMSNYIPQQMIIVKEESDKTGWSYKDGALEPYYVQFGNAWALGMLNELAIIMLAKKLGLGSWMNYIEKYGIPPVFVTSDRQDKKRLDELFEMMLDFRNNFFAVLSGNEKVEYGKEAGGNTTDAFLPLEERCDNQISKRLLGQTGTTENGAWEGTAEVHERVEKSRHEYDKMLFQFYFNYIIIPKLVKISPVYKPLERLKLKWDDTESLSITEYIEAINKLAYTFEFDHEEVAKKTGLPIIGQKKNPGGEQQGGTLPNQPKTDPQKKKTEPDDKAVTSPVMEAGEYDFSGIIGRVMKQVYERKVKTGDIDEELFRKTYEELNKKAAEGWGKDDYDDPEQAEEPQRIRDNLFKFSGAKTYQEIKEMNDALYDENGKKLSYKDFREKALAINKDYNENYLRTEFETAETSGRRASEWQEFKANADIMPNLKYVTAGDERVRESHRILDGVVKPINDPFWLQNYPPNGYRCRCYVEQTNEPETPATPMVTIPDAFANNVGQSGEIFTVAHPYFSMPDEHLEKIRKETERSKLYAPYHNDPESKVLISDFADPKDLVKNVESARVISKELKMKIKIRPHINEDGVKNPEYLINEKLADLKNIQGLGGIKNGLDSSRKQQCEYTVFNLDAFESLKPEMVQNKLNGIYKLYGDKFSGQQMIFIYSGKAVKVSWKDVKAGKVTKLLKELQE